MKLNTAFKLSALAVAFASTSSVFAATGNSGSLVSDSTDWNAVVNPTNPATKDATEYQFVDLNSQKIQGDIKEKLDASKVGTQLFITGAKFNEDGEILNYQELIDTNASAYLKVGEGEEAVYYAAKLEGFAPGETPAPGQVSQHYKVNVDEKSGTTTQPTDIADKPALGGLSQYGSFTKTDSEYVRVVDGNFLQYGQKEVVSSGTTTKAGNLTDDVKAGPDLTGNIKEDIQVVTNTVTVKDQTITVGDIYTADLNQPGKGLHTAQAEHALQIKDVQNDAAGNAIKNQTSTLTVSKLELKDELTGTSTVVTNSGITTTGNVSAASITLAGKDLATTIADGDAATLAAAKDYTDTTATTLRGEIAAGDAATLTAAKEFATAGDAATLKSAQDFAKAEDVKTLAAADTAAKAGDAATLTAAKSYTDTQVASFNTRVDQLNKRVNDVEEVANRGVAIALAAQQQIPNIAAGQVAVFGGVGHYEGETAAALGLATVFGDGRTSLSAAVGVAGGSEVGGRVGVAYVFGGK